MAGNVGRYKRIVGHDGRRIKRDDGEPLTIWSYGLLGRVKAVNARVTPKAREMAKGRERLLATMHRMIFDELVQRRNVALKCPDWPCHPRRMAAARRVNIATRKARHECWLEARRQVVDYLEIVARCEEIMPEIEKIARGDWT